MPKEPLGFPKVNSPFIAVGKAPNFPKTNLINKTVMRSAGLS